LQVKSMFASGWGFWFVIFCTILQVSSYLPVSNNSRPSPAQGSLLSLVPVRSLMFRPEVNCKVTW